MMGSRPVRESAEFVIWSATALLGVMVGIGVAFTLWTAFHKSPDQAVVGGGVIALGLGLSLVAVAIDNLTARLFVWAAAGSTLIAFFAAPGFFAAIAG